MLKSLLRRGKLWVKAREVQTMFLLLTSLDNSFVGQNVRLLTMEKLGVTEAYLHMPPTPWAWRSMPSPTLSYQPSL